ncbi:unnamed protein product [Nezara viridula]|uniref:Oxidized purine nucleoside triphosphate hydrolase n=1 Tax=Nezara viridula TaxID=85310 RepID=A0A9P0HF21_NEZVI|nr:unnamed protein product [Nezara viridula]
MKPVITRRFTMRILRISLVIVKNENKVLLGLCKRGFNKDKYCVPGGVLQPKEDLQSCAIKNPKEQCGITIEKLEKVGKIEVKFAGVQELLQFHIFMSDSYSGDIKETKEMTPEWFPLSDVPYDKMWQDMTVWLPHVLKGKKVKAFFIYQNEELIYQDLTTEANFGPRTSSSVAIV